jgi:hypothetical protein
MTVSFVSSLSPAGEDPRHPFRASVSAARLMPAGVSLRALNPLRTTPDI